MDELFAWLERYAQHIQPYYPTATVAAAKQEVAELRGQLAIARKTLEEIDSWRDHTLGKRPPDPSPYRAPAATEDAFDRGCRMAFVRCSNHARVALELTKSGQLEGSD